MKFNIGDRIIINSHSVYNYTVEGTIGTIIQYAGGEY